MEKQNTDNTNAEEQILQFLKKHPEGVTNEMLLNSIDVKNEEIVEKLSSLIECSRVYISEINGEILFKYRTEREASKFRDLTPEEVHTYSLIIDSGPNGISTNEVKSKLGMNMNLLNKILKKLEKKLLIKSLKMVNMKNKKIWIGYDIEPSQEVTGGIWCSNQEFDKNLVEVIKQKCLEYLERTKIANRKDFIICIKSIGIIQSEIKEDDIQKIINLLVFDDKIEPIFPNVSIKLSNKMNILLKKNEPILNQVKYKISSAYEPKTMLNSLPCTYCRVFRECQIGNVINPIDCPWMQEYIKYFDF